ncbi:MAG: hypothetical protein V4684_08255 [Pseudomonadota bacterium]
MRDLSLAGAAVALALAVVQVNLLTGCRDPELQVLLVCSADANTTESMLRRLADEPGNAALARQVALSSGPAASNRAQLEAAGRLAPQEPNLLLARARAAALAGELEPAVNHLVRLAQHTNNEQALASLAKLVSVGGGEVLVPHISADSRWLVNALDRAVNDPGRLSNLSSLVVTGYQKGVISPEQLESLLRRMVQNKQATDAYAIWAALNPQGLPLLSNSNFREPINQGVFNWASPTTRSGATLKVVPDGGRGILEVRLSGRTFEPTLLRQMIMVPPGQYKVAGEWKSGQLRLEQGLEWAIRCEQLKPKAQGKALVTTEGRWQPFAFTIEVPEQCGPIATLELRTVAEFESKTGTSGVASFRDIRMSKIS